MEKTCSEVECSKTLPPRGTAKGMCTTHYARYLNSLRPHEQCVVPACPSSAREIGGKYGMCNKHHIRNRRHGTPFHTVSTPKGLTVAEKIARKVKRDPVTQCLVWQAPPRVGYGCLYVEGKMKRAHRLAWEVEVGAIPEGLVLDHLCENKMCVNVTHLEPVTQYENMQRVSFRPLDKRIAGIVYA